MIDKPTRKSTNFIMALLVALGLAACNDSAEDASGAGPKAVAVTVAQSEAKDVHTRLNAIGRLVSTNAPVLASELNARVVEVLVDEGEPVAQGQVLVRLDTTAFELARREAQAAIEQLTVSIDNESRRVKRYRDLKTTQAMSQERLDDAEAKLASDKASKTAAEARLAIAEDRLSKADLVSPVDGTVERRHVAVGDYVRPGDPLVSVTDTQDLRAELPFPETVGHMLRPGQPVILESLIAPGMKHEAVIDHIRPQVGSVNRALMVIAEIENPGAWRPEATVSADVIVGTRHGAVVVPFMALVERPAGTVIYVLDDASGGAVSERVVEPGARQNGMIEILSGLEAGLTVVKDGASYLTDGALVEVRGGS